MADAPDYAAMTAEEIKRRINVAVWSYAYEVMSDSIVDDHVFDQECLRVNLKMSTSYMKRDNRALDKWFRENFDPCTGSWVWSHPDIAGLHRIYCQVKKLKGVPMTGMALALAKQQRTRNLRYAKGI